MPQGTRHYFVLNFGRLFAIVGVFTNNVRIVKTEDDDQSSKVNNKPGKSLLFVVGENTISVWKKIAIIFGYGS